MTAATHDAQRFEFGRNWLAFLDRIDEPRIFVAQQSLADLMQMPSLQGRRFLDVGCGSGLSSLAARRLGADVFSFDYDTLSVATTRALRDQFAPADPAWSIEQGSVLDSDYLSHLGEWDVVYSWGVLHHTGSMWRALELVSQCVAPGGLLIVAIYNDESLPSRLWRAIKRAYVSVPLVRPLLLAVSAAILWSPSLLHELARGRITTWWTKYQSERGMSRWHDLVDWVGGYPFEVASPDKIIDFYESRGYRLERLVTTRRLGCNQFSFPSVATSCDTLSLP